MQSATSVKKTQNDFRLLLQQEFVERCRKNQSYSLRAYARALKIEPSPLSAILRGKRPLTVKMQQRLGLALGLSVEHLLKLERPTRESFSDAQQITLDHFAIISDWYHYAILELTKTRGFKGDVAVVSKRLGISATEAHIAVERLKRVGLLEIKRGKWTDTSANGFATNISDGVTSSASKKLQRQVLQMSLKALDEVGLEERSHTSITMAIHPDDLPEASARIRKFRRELCAHFEKNKTPTHVYHMNISLYPVTKKDNQ